MQIFTVVVIAELITLLADRLQHRRARSRGVANGRHPDPAGQGGGICASGVLDPVLARSAAGGRPAAASDPGAATFAWDSSSALLFLIVWTPPSLMETPRLIGRSAVRRLPFRVCLTRSGGKSLPGLARAWPKGLFVPLFFASAGLQFSLSFITLPVWTMIALALIPFFRQLRRERLSAPTFPVMTVPYAVASGLMGKGVAEIALLLVL